ncbi:MAG TPA: hypothetical protein VFT87_04510 [Candidatus Saccharimonadales bacterium]|nr:hypothetical protein [Candidatus Saccharimonadales bacterium]
MNATHVRLLFIAVAIAIGILNFWLLDRSIRLGRPWQSTLVVLIASPVVIVATWLFVQRATPAFSTFTPGNISYAATFGDLLILTTVVALTARQWRLADGAVPEFFLGRTWLVISYGAGLLYGLITHFVLGGKPDSNSQVLGEQLHDSGTSWAHNLGVAPALAAALISTLVPLFFVPGDRMLALLITTILVVGWGGLVVFDIVRSQLDPSHPLYFNPQWLDVAMDWLHLRPRA